MNNAGIAAPSGKPVHEIAEDEWSLMLDIDPSGSWRAMRAVLPTMVAQRSGSVITLVDRGHGGVPLVRGVRGRQTRAPLPGIPGRAPGEVLAEGECFFGLDLVTEAGVAGAA